MGRACFGSVGHSWQAGALASVLGLDIQEVLQRAVGSGDEDGGQGAAKLPPA